MRVGIDGRNIHLTFGTGVATYARATREAYRRLGDDVFIVGAHREVDRSSAVTSARRLLRAATRSRQTLLVAGDAYPGRDLFRTAHVRSRLVGGSTVLEVDPPLDLMHWTYPLPLEIAGVPNIVTVHDLIPLTHPGLTTIDGRLLRRRLDVLLPRVAHVLTVSDRTRRDVIDLFGCRPERVTNAGQAVDLSSSSRREIEAAAPVCPPGAYVAVGVIERRKNIARLIDAHDRSGVAAPLVLIGPDGVDAEAELAAIRRHRRGASAVRRVPYASRPALLRAVRDAKALLFPSLAEGFGLPIIEAMSLGTPVLTSSGGTTAETAGDAALLVDPTRVEAIADGIRRIDRDAGLRHRLIEAGRLRASDFSPERFAARLDAIRTGVRAAGEASPCSAVRRPFSSSAKCSRPL